MTYKMYRRDQLTQVLVSVGDDLKEKTVAIVRNDIPNGWHAYPSAFDALSRRDGVAPGAIGVPVSRHVNTREGWQRIAELLNLPAA